MMKRAEGMRVVFDTDCGTDDLIALAYLVSCQSIDLVAVTTVHGLTSAKAGAQNVRRVLSLLGKPGVPVFVGAESPLNRDRAFPIDWRVQTEALNGVTLPIAPRPETNLLAADFLRTQFDTDRDLTILALGPWTNIAQALRSRANPTAGHQVSIFAMGGALDTNGNVSTDSINGAPDPQAEWNFYLDPEAVSEVLTQNVPTTLVPLDATETAAIRNSLTAALSEANGTTASSFVAEVIGSVQNWIGEGHYFAWDAVAAVLLVHPEIGTLSPQRISIETEGVFSGHVRRDMTGVEIPCFISASIDQFERIFVTALRSGSNLAVDG